MISSFMNLPLVFNHLYVHMVMIAHFISIPFLNRNGLVLLRQYVKVMTRQQYFVNDYFNSILMFLIPRLFFNKKSY